MKRLYLIRHAKSSWSDLNLDDFSRPLNKRGQEDCPEMATRLVKAGIRPDLIVASPAKRAKKTACCIAKGTGYDKKDISYYDELYNGTLSYYLLLIEKMLSKVEVLFLVGHNPIISELSEYLTGRSLGNVPTCGIVAVDYPVKEGFSSKAGAGKLVFFDYPKKQPDTGVRKC